MILRTIFSCVTAFNLFLATANGQLIRSFGVKAGLCVANQTWHQSQQVINLNPSARVGADIGCFVEWLSLPVVSVSTEASYVQRGFNSTITFGANGSYSESVRADYLSFPVLAKIRNQLGPVELYGLVGPRLDVLLHTDDAGYSRETINQSKATELGGTFAVGIQAFQPGAIQLGAEIRYSPSFQDAYANEVLSVRNHSVDLLLLMSF